MRKAMIFAAGLGTRLKPLTDNMPKAMVPVAGKPLIDHVLGRLTSAGIDDITVNVHHFPQQIISHLDSRYGLIPEPGAGVHVSDESELLLDTGGGVLAARRFLEGEEPFLVHNVDILSNLDFSRLAASAKDDSLATLVVSERKTSRYLLFDEDLRLVGWTNTKTGEVRSPWGDINPDNYRKLAFSGIHLMSGEIFSWLEEFASKVGAKFSIIDFYLDQAKKHPIHAYVPDDFKMMDVGKFDLLSDAEAFARELLF